MKITRLKCYRKLIYFTHSPSKFAFFLYDSHFPRSYNPHSDKIDNMLRALKNETCNQLNYMQFYEERYMCNLQVDPRKQFDLFNQNIDGDLIQFCHWPENFNNNSSESIEAEHYLIVKDNILII
ncbi:hypothetical protein DINM_003864 [Dirofilaria immitis]|nr:hypothetical protein [Dirofilaria immitis]